MVELCFGAATAAKAKNLDHRLSEIEARGNLPGDTFEIKKLTFDVLHRLAARADKMVMRFEVSIHTQCGGVRRDLAQKAALNEKTQVVVHSR